MPFRVGQTATDPKTGERVKFDGQNWVKTDGVAGASMPSSSGRGASQDISFLNELSRQANEAGETQRVYRRAARDVKTLGTGPYRGTMMQIATPEDGGGFFDRLGAVAIGGPLRLLGGITPQETTAYQKLRGLQSQQVLQAQLAQKGPQTESDAARMKLTEISPSKTAETNNDIIRQGIAKTNRVRARAAFYGQWAKQFGLHGTNKQGLTADQVWASDSDRLTNSLFPDSAGPSIKVLSRTRIK